jgi:mono/diheme cytochrome c family protein
VRLIVGGAVAMLAGFALIQLIPYGKDHQNPPVVNEPPWDSPRTRELFFTACKDCHSNETTWPWYASVAPVSWLVYHDVEEGRSEFNVSRWGQGEQEAEEAAGLVREGEMPLWFYLPVHPEARLSEADTRDLVRGLVATFGDQEADREGHDGHEGSE